jgi:hypothetical protein
MFLQALQPCGNVLGWGFVGNSPSGFTVLAGVFLTGAAFVAEEVALTGVGPVLFLSALTALEVEAVAVDAGVFLIAVGRGFFVAAGVDAGFEALLTAVFAGATGVFLAGVAAAAGLLVEAVGNVF